MTLITPTYQTLLRQVSLPQRTMGRLLPFFEHNLAHTKFLQDLVTTWVPKVLITRSLAELNESTYLEFIENAMVYYGITGVGQKLFKPLFMSLSPQKFNPKLFALPFAELVKKHPTMVKHILPVKAAIIFASLGVTLLSGEFSFLFLKNMMTEKLFRKSHFSDVVNLTHRQLNQQQESPVWKKAKRRLIECAAVSAGVLAISTGLTLFGSRLPRLLPALKKMIHWFDFGYKENGRFALTRPLIRIYMAVSLMGYLDAARDRLERLEILTRTPMVMLFISSGSEIIEKGLSRFVGKTCPDVLKHGKIKSIDEIFKTVNPKKFAAVLKAKNTLFYVPLGISILIPGIGLGLLSQFWTAYRFKQQAKEALIKRPPHGPHHPQMQPFMPIAGTSRTM